MEYTNIPSALNHVATEMEKAIKNQLLAHHLVKSGGLLNSVTALVVPADTGIELRTYMLEYGLKLDSKYHFMDKAITPMVSSITDSLLHATTMDITNHLQQIIQH